MQPVEIRKVILRIEPFTFQKVNLLTLDCN
jgi:hypothetical protein